MKPLKGMNQDISSANKTEATYTKAMNFVYGTELDALLQEPGMKRLKSFAEYYGIMGCVPLRNDNFLLFTYTSGSHTGEGSAIRRFDSTTNLLDLIDQNDGYQFLPSSVLSAATFFNDKNEEFVIFTDNVNPVRIINIHNPETDLSLNALFANYTPSSFLASPAGGAGSYLKGTHFFCVAYELQDGSKTAFHGIVGPYVSSDNAAAFDISLAGLDTDFEWLLIGSISFVNAAIITKIQERVAITGTSMVVGTDGINPYKEASLEELIGNSATYTKAKTCTIHNNRLYLGNLTENEEISMQPFANKVQPLWVYGDTYQGNVTYPFSMDAIDYPTNMLFMPGEVYAFYISYIRKDGSSTRAYHIPGEAPVQLTDQTDPWNDFEFYGYTFQSDATCASIMEEYSDERYAHLANDITIQGPGAKFFRTRCTAHINNSFDGAQDLDSDGAEKIRGNMGFWENEDEIYPADFPPQERITYASGAEQEIVLDSIPLAGKKVRHHKIPSTQWMGCNHGLEFRDLSNPQMIRVEFDHVIIPEGYSAARIYYAKRTRNNATIQGQAPLFLGHTNSYAQIGTGTVNDGASNYTAFLGVNLHNNNFLSFTGSADDQVIDRESYRTGGMVWEVGKMHPPEMLSFKPAISRSLGTHYIMQEYITSATGDYTDPELDVAQYKFSIDHGDSNAIETLYANDSFDGLNWRNRNQNFNNGGSYSRFHRVRNRHAILPIQDSKYIAAGVIDTENQIDNRGSEESLSFNIKWISEDITVTNNHTPNPSTSTTSSNRIDYADHLMTRLSHVSGSSSGATTPTTGFLLDRISPYYGNVSGTQAGYLSDSRSTSAGGITNYCTYRDNVYSYYNTQDLVACTGMITADTLEDVTTGPANETAAFTTALGEYYSGVAGRVEYSKVYGDLNYSRHRFRSTSQVGWDSSSYAEDDSLDSTNHNVSYASDIGTVRIGHNVHLMSPINPKFIDTTQSAMDTFTYLGSAERTIDPDQSNDYTYDISYLKLNDWKQPGVYTLDTVTAPTLPYRVARSQAQTDDAKDVNLRFFPVLDSYEQTRSRGEIVNLQGFNDKLIIHHALGLFVTRGQEKLATSTGEITFGDGDIFATKPIEVIPTTYGYGGTQHQLSCALTPLGYFFADESQGKLFQYTDKLVNIGALGLSNFLKTNLKVRKDVKSTEALLGFFPGIQTTYDPWFERVIFHLRNWEGESEDDFVINTLAYIEDSSVEQAEGQTAYYEGTKNVKDFYLSYTPANNSWTSFHNYNTLSLVSTRDALYSINTTLRADLGPVGTVGLSIYKHNDFTKPVGSFALKRKSAYIDIAFPFGQGAILSDINWYTKVVDGNPEAVSHKEHDVTFTHAMVYNDYQCSGNISLIRTARGVNGGEDVSGNMRRTDYKWFFNQFRDLVNDRTLSFIDEEGAVIDANIDTEKPWNEQKRFVGNFANVRLTLANTEHTTNALYLYDVDAKVRKSYR